MKRSLYSIITLFLLMLAACGCGHRGSGAGDDLRPLLDSLDREIAGSEEYEAAKDGRIRELRKIYESSASQHERISSLERIIAESDAFNADTTIHYVNLALSLPGIKSIPGEYTKMQIKKADIYAHSGLFPDALEQIGSIPRDSLTGDNLEYYYATYCAIYQYLAEYADKHETAYEYENLRAVYTDSLNSVVRPDSFNHQVYVMAKAARDGNTEEAIARLSGKLKEYEMGTREYSILASTLSYVYKLAGRYDEYKRYLALSAISDTRAAVKENMSFREMATVMFEEGDVERANRYLKKSIEDANFYSALMRNVQSGKLLPIIDEAYNKERNALTFRLKVAICVVGVLFVGLVIALLFVLRAYRSLHAAHRRINEANTELTRLSERLKIANEELSARNVELRESNLTKEQYAGLFMEYCSSAISTLQRYQQSLKVASKGGNRAALQSKLESTEISDQLLSNFYERFDEAIHNIYPDFVDKFNSLLRPEERIILKSGELLNTELRLYALVRLGIDDSSKIAEFLRCSISTVYTYRSKMRKRALNPDTFEDDVRALA